MGTDIDFFVEVQDDLGRWNVAEESWTKCGWCNHRPGCCDRCRGGRRLDRQAFYEGRDYGLFGILSGLGEADEAFTIRDRGLPPDVSPELAGSDEDPNCHHHGYYTVEELEKYPWAAEERDEFAHALDKMRKLHADPRRVRGVFWYSS